MIQSQVSLDQYTYAKIGGIAEHLAVVTTPAQLTRACHLAQKNRWPLTILGSASNVLISDQGLAGLVIINRLQTQKIIGSNQVEAASGVPMNRLVNFCLDHSLAGLEEFLGIPGTVGGAVYNNSHHLDHLLGDRVVKVRILNSDLQTRTLSAADCRFGYDRSIFQSKPWIILSAVFKLTPGDPAVLKSRALSALKRRRQSQPLEFPSAGCMFKNLDPATAQSLGMPDGITAAGWLVDRAGLKGKVLGGAMVSPKHANFIVNHHQATAADYVALSNLVRREIHRRYGIWLEREIFFLGPHPGLETNAP